MNTTTETRKPQPDKLETVLLPHHYTPSERLAMSETQNQALEEIDRLESEASRISKELAKKIKAQFELVQQIRGELKKGVTQRQQEVVTTFDPTAGKKVYFHPSDTGKLNPLGCADMTEKDYELELPLA